MERLVSDLDINTNVESVIVVCWKQDGNLTRKGFGLYKSQFIQVWLYLIWMRHVKFH